MLDKMDEFNYEIEGLKIVEKDLDDSRYRCIVYKTWLCKIAVASDDLGTHICYNGVFWGSGKNNFGGYGFKDIEDAVENLRNDKDDAIKFFRRVWLRQFKYWFSKSRFKFLYWKVRHRYNPSFYLNQK